MKTKLRDAGCSTAFAEASGELRLNGDLPFQNTTSGYSNLGFSGASNGRPPYQGQRNSRFQASPVKRNNIQYP
jgi:hypothetical protein